MSAKLLYGQVQRSAMNWPFYCASDLDLFADFDLIVEARIFTRPPDPVAALVHGSLDIINVIPDLTLIEMVKGAPLSLIANTNSRAQYRLLAQSDIRDYAGLKGKKIGVNDGRSAEALILRRLLKQRGLDPDACELAPSGPPPERCKKLSAGVIAATMVSQPFDFFLEQQGFHPLGSSVEIVPSYPFTVSVVRKEEEVQPKVLCFLKAWKRAWDWLADPGHRERAARILSRHTEIPERQAAATYDLYLNPPSPPSLAPAQEGVTTVLKLLAESGYLPYPLPPARRYIDERYFKRLET